MCHELGVSVEFCVGLWLEDEALAEQVRAQGCRFCGGRLHRADYPRKVRGLSAEVDPLFEKRASWCCGREGCRRRHTPPSMRFLGRKIYAAIVVVMAIAGGVRRTDADAPRRERRWRAWWSAALCRRPEMVSLAGQMAHGQQLLSEPAQALSKLQGTSLLERAHRFLSAVAKQALGLRFAAEGQGRSAHAEDGR